MTVLGEGELPLGHWRSAGSFGLFYFRKGPDFVSVVDQRSEATNRFIVDDAVLIDVLRQGMSGCAWADVTRTPQYAAAARDLVGKGLILRVGDYCVTLPVHMRRWPVGTLLLGGTLAAAGTKKSVLTVDRQL
ncbi:hypothetical protein CcI6DRAFT_04835 [Frankia sp. CcI6]|uniref:DUF5825 family protein n=1 Tax=unclassified Frankia TaxID=2632575 RepID=UPI0003D06E10|nr:MULTISPECIES: DUF5825 family protein [unclassified Frankia]ESZ99758.1 hypothetical protein CcI6DRAFT_04835 [Frankia sp. CcI6]OHV47491.1 hypothetical protein CgIS1_22205 [Frankia sp. CgIS1]